MVYLTMSYDALAAEAQKIGSGLAGAGVRSLLELPPELTRMINGMPADQPVSNQGAAEDANAGFDDPRGFREIPADAGGIVDGSGDASSENNSDSGSYATEEDRVLSLEMKEKLTTALDKLGVAVSMQGMNKLAQKLGDYLDGSNSELSVEDLTPDQMADIAERQHMMVAIVQTERHYARMEEMENGMKHAFDLGALLEGIGNEQEFKPSLNRADEFAPERGQRRGTVA